MGTAAAKMAESDRAICQIVRMDEGLQPCRVLEEDPDLAEAVPATQRESAIRDCLAHCLSIPAGRWLAESQTNLVGEAIGLLMLGGLLIRRVAVDGRFGAELLGAGDLLRPWQGEEDPPTLQVTTGWRVIEPARMAILDEPFARRAARYPTLTGRLVGRAMQRSRNLAVNMAIVHQTRVDIRLQMLLWHLARRWGRVRTDGVLLPVPLTHALLADLTASRRPTVTGALTELAREQRVQQTSEGWLLHGQPPGELFDPSTQPAIRQNSRATTSL